LKRNQETNRQNDIRRQQEQRNIEQQQQQNRNAFERRQNEMRTTTGNATSATGTKEF
jgi:hypothetical protein